MDLNRVAVFVEVVQRGSFTAAAHALGLPKSSVSRAVAALEGALGVRLLQRTTRQLHLTDAGREYFARVSVALAGLEEAAAAAGEHGEAPRGRIRMTAPSGLAEALGGMLARFVKRYPRVHVDVVATSRVVDLAEEGVDLALRAGALPDSTLVARKVLEAGAALFATPAYLRRRGRPRRLADLAGHEVVLYRAPAGRAMLRLKGPAGEEAVEVTGRLTADEMPFVLGAALEGLGVALLPELAAIEPLSRGQLVRVLPEYRQPHAAVYLVVPPGRYVPTRVAVLRDFLTEELRKAFGPGA